MKRILITGADGFTARHLAAALQRRKCEEIFGIGLAQRPAPGLSSAHYRCLDVTDGASVTKFFSEIQPTHVYHLAGLFSGDPQAIYRVNILGAISILRATERCCPEACVLLVGSAAEYGPLDTMPLVEEAACRPRGAYGISKYAATLAALDAGREWGAKVIVARPFNLVGAGVPPFLVVGALLRRILAAIKQDDGGEIEIGRTDTCRDFIAVEDATEGYVRLMEAGAWGEVFNICSGRPTRIGEIAEILLSLSPKPLRLSVSQKLVRPDDVVVSYGSDSKARRVAGFRAETPLRDALNAAWVEAFRKT